MFDLECRPEEPYGDDGCLAVMYSPRGEFEFWGGAPPGAAADDSGTVIGAMHKFHSKFIMERIREL